MSNFARTATDWLWARRGCGGDRERDCGECWSRRANCGHSRPEGTDGDEYGFFSTPREHAGTLRWNQLRSRPHCADLVRRALAGEEVPPDATAAVAWDGEAMREECERVLNARRIHCQDCIDGRGVGYPCVCLTLVVASVLWTGSTPHTQTDSWLAVLDDGRLALAVRRPKVESGKGKRCPWCRGTGVAHGCNRAGAPKKDLPACSLCNATGRIAHEPEYVDPKGGAWITGTYSDLPSALASIPECYLREFAPDGVKGHENGLAKIWERWEAWQAAQREKVTFKGVTLSCESVAATSTVKG